jgi:hypothetical protein
MLLPAFSSTVIKDIFNIFLDCAHKVREVVMCVILMAKSRIDRAGLERGIANFWR